MFDESVQSTKRIQKAHAVEPARDAKIQKGGSNQINPPTESLNYLQHLV